MSGRRKLLVLLMIVAAAGGLAQSASASSFAAPRVVDASHQAGGGTSVAIQPSGQVHIGYQDATGVAMQYATNAYGWDPSWAAIQEVDHVQANGEGKETGVQSSLAVDSAGNVHACYYDAYRQQVMYTNNAAGDSWAAPVPTAGGINPYSAIVVDSANRVHILAIGDSQAKYFTVEPGAGMSAPQTLPGTNCSGRVQLAVDANRRAHALYVAGGDLYYSTNASGSWQPGTLIEAGVAASSPMALCVDANGKAHAAYLGGTALRYATNAGGSWAAQDVKTGLTDGDVGAIHIAADATGVPTIDWFNPTSGQITRTGRGSGDWPEAWSVALAGVAGATDASIVTDGDKVHLACTKADTEELMHVTNAADPQGADVAVTQTRSPDAVVSREDVTYTITARNLGAGQATGVVVEDDLPAAPKSVSTNRGTYTHNPTTQRVTWNIGNLAKGEVGVMTITVTAPSRGTLVNKAAVTSALGEDFRTANNVADDSSNPLSITPLQHPLVLSVAGSVGGTLRTEQPAQALYDEGSTVPVVATPDPGYQVQGWSGTVNDASTSNTNAVEIGPGEATTVQVRFEKIPRKLIVVAGANGTVNPLSGIYGHGDVVTLTASPKSRYQVALWSGTDHDDWTGNVNTVTMDGDRNITVQFGPAPNQMPVALGALPAIACPGDQVLLDGTQSYDPDEDTLSYKWESEEVDLSDSTSVKATFTAPNVDEELIVEVSLTVSDGQLQDKQVYVMKIMPATLPGPRCGPPIGTGVCFYALCWVGLACMKWRPAGGRRRGTQA